MMSEVKSTATSSNGCSDGWVDDERLRRGGGFQKLFVYRGIEEAELGGPVR